MNDRSYLRLVRDPGFAWMLLTQFLGALNDNLYRYVVTFFAIDLALQQPDGMLANTRKHRVAKLVQATLQQPRAIVGDHQHQGAEHDRRQEFRRSELAVQRVGGPFEEIGHQQQHDLGNQQEDGGPNHPHLEIGASGRPHIGPEIDNGLQCLAGFGRYDFFFTRHGTSPACRK